MSVLSHLAAHRWWAVVSGAAIISVGAVAMRALDPTGAQPADRLLVADVDNASGDTLLDHSLAAATNVALRASRRIRVFPRADVSAVYRLMEIGNRDTTLSFDLAQEVAERARVRFVLGVRVDSADGSYAVSARVMDITSHRTLGTFTAKAKRQNDVVAALDEVLVNVRRQLGESTRETSDDGGPLPVVTTPSLAALRSFADGGRAWRVGDYPRAGEAWRRAVELDTGFAMAYGALGTLSYYMHNRDDGDRFFGQAFQFSNRLTPRELLQLQLDYAASRGNLDSAIALAREAAERYPGADTWSDYGIRLMRVNRADDAIVAFRKSIAMDATHATVWINLATSHSLAHHIDSSLAAYARAGALDSTILYRNNINHEYGSHLVTAGRVAEADSVFRRMAASTRLYDRSLGLRSLGYLALWRGHFDDAIEAFQSAAEASRQQPSALSEARNRLLLATAYLAANRVADANTAVSRAFALADSHDIEPTMLAVVAYQCERLGRTRDLDSLYRLARARATAENVADRESAAFIETLVHLSRHQSDSAVQSAARAATFSFQLLHRALAARAFVAAGQPDSARASLEALRATEGFGVEGEDEWIRGAIPLGDALLAARDTTGARREYESLLMRWHDAPATTPELVAAKQRIAAIAAPHGRR